MILYCGFDDVIPNTNRNYGSDVTQFAQLIVLILSGTIRVFYLLDSEIQLSQAAVS